MSQQLDSFEEGMRNFFDTSRTYGKPIGIAAAIAFVIALGLVGYSAYDEKHEVKAVSALYPIESDYLKNKEAFNKSKFKDMAPPAAADEKAEAPKKASGDMNQDFGQAISGFEKVASDYSGTKAGTQASLYLADIYGQYGQFDKAIEAATTAAKKANSKDMIYSLANLVLGNAYADKGDCKQAVDAYAKVTSKTEGFLKPDAYLKSGVCYENLGQADRAAEMYKKASEDSQSSTGQTARTLLRALEMKKSSAPQKG